jgi:hypothetical protein
MNPVVYTKTTWANGVSPSISAANLNKIETGIADAHYGIRGVPLDGFAGADDNAKLTAAMSYAAAQTYPPPILLAARNHTFSGQRTLYDGFALHGVPGPSNAEKSSVGVTKTRCAVSVGSSLPWLVASGGVADGAQVWDVSIRDIAFVGNSTTQWMGGAAVLWVMHLNNLSFKDFKSILGSQSTKLLMNLCLIDGWMSLNASYNGAIHIGGSDNALFLGLTNLDSGTAYNSAGSANGQYHMWLDGCEKTTIGPMYITAEGGWNGIRVTGTAYNTDSSNLGGPNWIAGARIEGRNSGAPCNGSLVRVEGGMLTLRDCWLGYAMDSPSTPGHSPADAGAIHQSGGQLLVDGCTYDRTAGQAETVKFVYSNGGVGRVSNTMIGAKGGAWSGLPRVSSALTCDTTVTEV